MSDSFRIIATTGPMEKVLKDDQGRLLSFPAVMYEFYSWDARIFAVEQIKRILENPATFNGLSKELRDKLRGILVLELVAKFCESSEDLAAFGIAFATELYMDALGPDEVWKRVAEYETGDIVNFYRDITLRGADYFANLHGYPPLQLQEDNSRMILFRSCKQLAGYMGTVAQAYMSLRELHNAYKHGMRVFFGSLSEKGIESIAIAYVDADANIKAVNFPPESVEEVYTLGVQLGKILGAFLQWHSIRIQVTKKGSISVSAPVFGHGSDLDKGLGMLFFPTLSETRATLVNEAGKVALEHEAEVEKIDRGHIIAVDIDAREILAFHSPNLRDVIFESFKARPGARLVFRRITSDGKVGPY